MIDRARPSFANGSSLLESVKAMEVMTTPVEFRPMIGSVVFECTNGKMQTRHRKRSVEYGGIILD